MWNADSNLPGCREIESAWSQVTLQLLCDISVTPLEGTAEAPAGTFNAHDVTNTLWACATMWREPGAEVVRELDGGVGGRKEMHPHSKTKATKRRGPKVKDGEGEFNTGKRKKQ